MENSIDKTWGSEILGQVFRIASETIPGIIIFLRLQNRRQRQLRNPTLTEVWKTWQIFLNLKLKLNKPMEK